MAMGAPRRALQAPEPGQRGDLARAVERLYAQRDQVAEPTSL